MPPAPASEMLLHPAHAILLGFPIALFTAALASDVTYLNSTQIQWSNFSAWLNAGGLFAGAFVVIWAAVLTVRAHGASRSRAMIYLLLLLAMWIVGFVNAFQHSGDAWSSVGTVGLVLSLLSALLALAAGWVGYSGWRPAGERP